MPLSIPPALRGRTWKIAGLVLIVLAGAGLIVAHLFWPFSESSVRSRLESATSAEVQFQGFHEKYFPPGCVANGVSLKPSGSPRPLVSIDRLTISSTLTGMLHHRVSLRAEGVHAFLSRAELGAGQGHSSQTTVESFVLENAVLDLASKGDQEPLRFVVHKLELHNMGSSHPVSFSAVFENPMPAGKVTLSGNFGPWSGTSPGNVALSGKYSLDKANLGVFHGIAGTLSSSGTLSGTVSALNVEGSTSTPDFEVGDTHHAQPLDTQFSATVNAMNGETVLRQVHATYGRDVIDAHGSIARGSDGKRRAVVDLACSRGRIEDTFYPFIHSASSPLTGETSFQMHVEIPPGKERFIKKIEITSDFQITDARFTNKRTETRVQKISAEPGQDQAPPGTSASLQGQVSLADGVAKFSQLTLQDQGASAHLHGTFNLVDQRLDMHGALETKASLSKTTSGIKSVFAKLIAPLFKKGNKEKVIPVKISGSYRHPSFGLDL